MFSTIWNYLITDNHYLSLLGIFIFLGTAVLFSNNKRKIHARKILGALGLQFFLAFFVLKTNIGFSVFSGITSGFTTLYSFTDAGINFIFGNLGDGSGNWGTIFAVKVLPIIVFFGALMAMLSHLKIVQFFMKIISFVIRPIIGTSGAETLCATANSMMGPTESPLLIKKFLKNMTDSEILVVMISGMATIAASVMAAYSAIGVPLIHLITASVMSIPGALLISKILIPETKIPETAAGNKFETKSDSLNLLDAIAQGTTDGLGLALSVGAMLIAFVSLMKMADHFLLITTQLFSDGYTLDMVFGKLFSGIAYILGITSQDQTTAGTLLGQKLVINEFLAYANMVKTTLAVRSQIILTYALCGFANIGVIGILIAGVGSLAPNKRSILTKLGFKALLGATLVNLLNAAIAGLLI